MLSPLFLENQQTRNQLILFVLVAFVTIQELSMDNQPKYCLKFRGHCGLILARLSQDKAWGALEVQLPKISKKKSKKYMLIPLLDS